jgi:histidinol-phosphate/aromatic aminotransferase/cobyric acid decarboxylase-like protein/choline kinase
MKAIILAAGRGARMRPLTDSKPKAMLQVAGQTIIERMLRLLTAHGISEICVVTGYCRDQLENHLCSSFPDVRFTFVFNDVYDKTNNIYSMHLAFEHFPVDDDVLLIESDLVFTKDVLEPILRTTHKNVALVDKYQVGMDGTVVTVDGELIANIIPPHLQGPGFDFSDKYKTLNIYRFSQEFVQTSFRKLLSFYATVYNDNCYYELILGLLVYMRQEQIFACNVSGAKWCEVDDANDLRLAEIAFTEEGRVGSLDKAFGGFWNIPVLDFSFIRNMYFPNHSILADMRYTLPSLVQNYGSAQAVLNQKLAYFLLVPKERVSLLNGLSQVYPMLEMLLGDKTILIPEPTFGEYTRVFRNRITYRDEGLRNLKDIPYSHIDAADVIVFVNPNNPTGSCIGGTEIMRLARQEPSKLIVVDESFIDFAEQESVQDLLQKEKLSNVWILKSLSKSLGVPGIRLGYVYARDEGLIQDLNNRIPIWNSNSLAEYFLEIILKYRQELAGSFESTITDRNSFAAKLASLAAVDHVYPSKANFILVRLKIESAQLPKLRDYLLNRCNIYVRDCSLKFGDGRAYMRIAVRFHKENMLFVEALSQCYTL